MVEMATSDICVYEWTCVCVYMYVFFGVCVSFLINFFLFFYFSVTQLVHNIILVTGAQHSD